MKIADIVIDTYDAGVAEVWPRHSRFKAEGESGWGMLIRVIAEDGTEGLRQGYAMATMGAGFAKNNIYTQASEILGRIKAELVGRDVMDREWLWSQRYVYQWWGTVSSRAIALIDDALWDLAGKLAGLPVCRMLGMARHKMPVYASCPYVPEPEKIADLAAQSKALGYRGYKIKPGGGTVDRIKTITRLTREAVGDGFPLMLDGQMQFSVREAIEIGKHLQDLDFYWWEDCIPHNDLSGYAELVRQLEIPIAYSDHPAVHFRELAELMRALPGLRIIRSDAPREGVTGLKKVCSLAEAYGINCELHSCSMGNLHVGMTITNCDFFEGHFHGAYDVKAGKLLRRGKDDPQYVDEEGYIHAPTAPGLSERIDVEHVESIRADRLS